MQNASPRFLRCALGLSMALAFPATPVWADGLRLGAGVDYSSGKYGGRETTQIFEAPLWLGYSRGAFDIRVTVPYIRVKGPGDVIPGLVAVVDDDEREDDDDLEDDPLTDEDESEIPTTTEEGLGDVTLSASYAFIDQPDAWRVAVGGKVKFGTADEDKNLGTGENDYSLRLDVERAIGRFTPFVGAGYRWIGDTPETDYKNPWFANVGLAVSLGESTTVDLAYDWSKATSNRGDDVSEISIGLSQRLGAGLRLQGYVMHGFSDGSPDWGGGASLTYYF